jgi:hypothetical protein
MAMPGEATQQRVVASYLAAINAERYEEAGALFASAGEILPPGTTPIRGTGEIAAYLRTALSAWAAHWETPTREIHGDGVAVVDIHFSGKDRSGTAMDVNAVYLFDFDADGAITQLRWCAGREIDHARRDERRRPAQVNRAIPDFDQVGILVTNLEAAMTALGEAVGVDWTGPVERHVGPWHLRIALSTDGRFELVEGEPGSPWDSSAGSRIDHLAYFVDDQPSHRQRLIDAGFPLAIDGSEFGGQWSYHTTAQAGMRIELVDATQREGYFARASGKT